MIEMGEISMTGYGVTAEASGNAIQLFKYEGRDVRVVQGADGVANS